MKKKNYLALAAGILMTTGLFAQPTLIEKVEPKPDKVVIPYERWKLPNGLTILLHEDHSDPVVHVQVTYKVGSNREDIGKSGFAHFFEHMMFQGSKHVADEEHFKMVSTAGGTMNGFTERDKTVYFETLPSNYLEMALWLESDRMGFLLDSLTSKKFENQRDAVKNEKSQNVENQPYALAFVEEINKAIYPMGHPYSWPVIGYVDDLNRASLYDVKNFFLRWYGPNNAILTISGDFDPKSALDMVDKYFGNLKQCPEVKKFNPKELDNQLKIRFEENKEDKLATDKYVTYKDRTYFPLNLRVYRTVPQYNRDEAALDILANMMGSGNNSIFYKKFVKNKLAIEAQVQHESSELAGELSFALFCYPPPFDEGMPDYGKIFREIDDSVKKTILEFYETGITEEALQRAKASFETSQYNGLSSVMGKAMTISEWERLLGKPSTISEEIERYNKVTLEDIKRVFKKYINDKDKQITQGAAVLNTYPIFNPKDSVKSYNPYSNFKFSSNPEYKDLNYSPVPDKFNRAERPVAGAVKPVKTPDYFNYKLNNGLTIIGTKNTETPEITLYMTMEGGSLVLSGDEIKKLGIAELTANLMNESTKEKSTEKISAELEKLGSSISFSANKTQTFISVECLKKNLDATLKLLEEKLLNPAFKEEDFNLAKKQYKEAIRNEGTSANTMASKAFDIALYGNTVMGLQPSIKSIEAITLKDVKNYYEKFYTPTGTSLVIVGDIDESEVKPKLEFLNKWTAKEVKIQPITEAAASPEPQFFIYNKDAAPSSVIMMGYPSLKYDATGDFYKNRIANFIFGGNFNSRLNLNLREDKGYTYGIRSSFSGDKYNGRFMINSSVKRSATAASLAEIMKEFKKYQADGITDKELEFTKNSLLNEEALKYEAPYQKASFLANIARNNLDKDYTAKQNQLLKSITKDEVNQQIKKYFDANKLTTVIAGDKYLIEKQLDEVKDNQNKETLKKVKLKKITID